MKFWSLSLLVILAFPMGCRAVKPEQLILRPVYEREKIKIEYKNVGLWGIAGEDSTEEKRYERKGIEIAFQTPVFEWYADANMLESEYLEDRYTNQWDTDGIEVGLGVKSSFPTEPGLAPQWGVRAFWYKMHEKGMRDSIYGDVVYEHDDEGLGADAHAGLEYAISIGRGFLLTPQAGYLYKYMVGGDDLDIGTLRVAETDHRVHAHAAYCGIGTNSKTWKGFDFLFCVYTGGHGLNGFMGSVGFRFLGP